MFTSRTWNDPPPDPDPREPAPFVDMENEMSHRMQAAIPLQMLTEKQWQAQIVQIARTFGWAIYHTYDSRRSQPGFPDLVLVRDRVLYIELKREQGKLTDAQAAWLDKLIAAGAEAYLWRPRDLHDAGLVLARREKRAA